MTALLKIETKLLLREPILLFWGVVFPLVLLTVMGLAGNTPDPDLGGLTLVQTYVPVLIAFTFTILGVSALPTALANYRERGVLKRLATTPLRPSRVLGAQLTTSAAMAAATAVLILALARIAFGVPLPDAPFAFLLAVILAAAALLGIGLLIAALAPRARVAGAIGTMLFFPLMFFAGLLALSAALVACSPIYGFFVWSGYLAVAFVLPRRWIPAGVLGVAAVTAASQVGGWPGGTFSDWVVYAAVVVANTGVAGTMMLVGAKQDDQRRRLEAALRENAGLH
jgi:ABC-2 type transport system permease protein